MQNTDTYTETIQTLFALLRQANLADIRLQAEKWQKPNDASLHVGCYYRGIRNALIAIAGYDIVANEIETGEIDMSLADRAPQFIETDEQLRLHIEDEIGLFEDEAARVIEDYSCQILAIDEQGERIEGAPISYPSNALELTMRDLFGDFDTYPEATHLIIEGQAYDDDKEPTGEWWQVEIKPSDLSNERNPYTESQQEAAERVHAEG